MKFRKVKKPKPLLVGGKYDLYINKDGEADFQFGYRSLGPREAVKVAQWLIRYAKWSSLQ